jgi:hypothetical protein
VTDEESSQIDTAEMENLNEKRKAENGIIIFNDRDSTVSELHLLSNFPEYLSMGIVLFLGCA